MKFWLFQRFGRGRGENSSSASPGYSSGKTMSIESLENVVKSRVRMFLRHTWLVTVLGTVALGALVWTAFYYSTKATVIRIAAGPAYSANAKLVELLTQKFVTKRDNIRLQIVATDGAKQSAQALNSRTADLAILPTTVGNSADWPVVAILRKNVIAFIVPPASPSAEEKNAKSSKTAKPAKSTKTDKSAKADKSAKPDKSDKGDKSTKGAKTAKTDDADDADDPNKLTKVPQLAGHRLGIVTGNEATADLLDVVLNHYGVPLEKVQVSQIDPKNIAEAIRTNQVDVLFVAGAATGKAINDAVAAATQNGQAPTFIDIDQAAGIAQRNPAFDSIDVDAGTFGGNPPAPDDTVKTLSFAEYLVARRSFSHAGVTILAKLIYSSRLAIAAQMAGEIKITAPSTDKDAAAIVHPGALDFLNDTQKSFFDKYGDDIFYGLLIFPIFGSAIAGMASYLRRDGRTRRLRLLQRALDLVRRAHTAQSLEAIDQLQIETDNLLIAIIHQSEREEPDQAVQMFYSMALEQVRFALAARRAVLIERGSTGTTAAAA
jgi:TRAP-type uncharacterized transport system substrate-binding protein